MSYRAGIGLGMERLGWEPGPPQIICDGCGVRKVLTNIVPPKWFLDGRAPPKWKLVRNGVNREDFCSECVAGGWSP